MAFRTLHSLGPILFSITHHAASCYIWSNPTIFFISCVSEVSGLCVFFFIATPLLACSSLMTFKISAKLQFFWKLECYVWHQESFKDLLRDRDQLIKLPWGSVFFLEKKEHRLAKWPCFHDDINSHQHSLSVYIICELIWLPVVSTCWVW